MSHYILASNRPWALNAFAARRPQLTGNWHVVTSPSDLEAVLAVVQPRYVFFPHWSHIVPQKILDAVECVCFHMTDVPYGRGGSPLQNLILRGHRETKLTALKMSAELDAGPVYCKEPMSLEGSAAEIYSRMAEHAMDMLDYITHGEPSPVPQSGEPSEPFRRRKPADSILPNSGTLDQLYDHIRMLDAPGYPHAFLELGDFRAEFIEAKNPEEGVLEAQVRIKRISSERDSL